MFQNGQSVEKDQTKAFKWYEQAANQGLISGLAGMYKEGLGVRQDYTKVFELYEQDANQGSADAKYSLGRLYEEGLGVRQDYTKAFELYEQAVNQGNNFALSDIASMYGAGRGVERDVFKAMNLRREQSKKSELRCAILDNVYLYGEGTGPLDEGQHLIKDEGTGIRKDYLKVIQWYEKAANQGDVSAQYSLGVMYERGEGVKQDYTKALEWYEKAANQGDVSAAHNLGMMYVKGGGVHEDYDKALQWFGKACDNGSQNSCDKYRILNERQGLDYSAVFLINRLHCNFDLMKENSKNKNELKTPVVRTNQIMTNEDQHKKVSEPNTLKQFCYHGINAQM